MWNFLLHYNKRLLLYRSFFVNTGIIQKNLHVGLFVETRMYKKCSG